MKPAIEVQGLYKSYRRGLFRQSKQILEDVSFCVPQGSVFGFLGPNGAGKSTTIKVLLNFVQPQGGVVRVLGESPAKARVRQRIGYLPETADYYGFLTPMRLLLLYCDMFGIPRREARPRCEHLLELVGLSRQKTERIHTFSKGMKQRVGIAQALLNEPELLILDEPASGLDPLGMREIRNLIIEQKRMGRTVFFSSHELSEIEAVCDEAAIIRAGRIVRCGTLSELVPYREELVVRVRGVQAEQLKDLAFVGQIRPLLQPGEISFIAQPGYSLEQLARLTSQSGAEVLSISTVRDSLEDIFLQLMEARS
jgi:ABC-2 type transport system ATP-binding protein